MGTISIALQEKGMSNLPIHSTQFDQFCKFMKVFYLYTFIVFGLDFVRYHMRLIVVSAFFRDNTL